MDLDRTPPAPSSCEKKHSLLITSRHRETFLGLKRHCLMNLLTLSRNVQEGSR
jgi:hypothetical protein